MEHGDTLALIGVVAGGIIAVWGIAIDVIQIVGVATMFSLAIGGYKFTQELRRAKVENVRHLNARIYQPLYQWAREQLDGLGEGPEELFYYLPPRQTFD